LKYRTILISDVHLGTRGCQAELLLDFLSCHEAETYYLVGDIYDGWQMHRGLNWAESHTAVVHALLGKAAAGARMVFVPGNHDEMFRSCLGAHFGGIEVMARADYVTADGRRYLVTHGDEFDAVVVHAKWLAHVGDRAYDLAIQANILFNRVRRLWGGPYWSLSKWAKAQVKRAVSHVSAFETALAKEARDHGYDGIICGHIHTAALREIEGIRYVNTGDWVESCTAVVEREDGSLHLLDWAAVRRRRALANSHPRLMRRRRQNAEAA
jgi:UDP-2,3-diacylglucosamine pyrophosphatase LpxH